MTVIAGCDARGRMTAGLVTAVLVSLGCGSDDNGAGTAAAGAGGSMSASSAGSQVGSGGATSGGSCASDPLHTGLTAQQTGVSVDAFDCPILEWTAKYKEPDA